MMSALAFGYGVGMVPPDTAIDDMRFAVDAYRHRAPPGQSVVAGQPPGPYHAWAGRGPTAPPAAGMPYPGYPYPPPYYYGPGHGPGAAGARGHLPPESSELARLRGGSTGATQCKLHGPNHTRPPQLASTDDGSDFLDDGQLDMAGQEALSRLQLPDFNVPITKQALKYVRFLTRSHRGRDLFESWLKRSGRYSDMVQQTLREWSLPEDLIWLAMIESGFDPTAKSPAGAMGMWQFMRSTGGVYGLEVNRWVDLRKHPIESTRAAAHHLRDLHARFGSWDLAFAAYNMGYEQLLDRIDRYGTTDFAELARQRALPSETTAYVPKIVAAALVANNLDIYGFADVKVYRSMHPSELSVPGGTSLATLARAAGVSKSTLRKYNPHLLAAHVPPGNEVTVLVPPESLSRARAALPAMMDMHVARNDADILTPSDLAGLSGDSARRSIWNENESLLTMLPKPKRRSLRGVLGGRRAPPATDPELGAVAEEFAPRRADREMVMYRVGPGDTLLGVAKQFVVDVDDLARDNDIEPDSKLREGALLKLMVKRRVLERWKKKAGGVEATLERTKPRPKSSKKSKKSKKKREG